MFSIAKVSENWHFVYVCNPEVCVKPLGAVDRAECSPSQRTSREWHKFSIFVFGWLLGLL